MKIEHSFQRVGIPTCGGISNYDIPSSRFVLQYDIVDSCFLKRNRGKWWILTCVDTNQSVYRTLSLSPLLHTEQPQGTFKIAIDWDAWIHLCGHQNNNKPLNLSLRPAGLRSLYLWPKYTISSPDPVSRASGYIALIGLFLTVLQMIEMVVEWSR